jgi:hypothetical protein
MHVITAIVKLDLPCAVLNNMAEFFCFVPDQHLFDAFGFVSIHIKMGSLPLLPGLLNAVPQLCQVNAALIVVVAQVIIPVKQP